MSDTIPQEPADATEQPPAPAPELPGRRLREAREASHLSREEVGHHLRLDHSLIRALEEDDYARLPSPAYICGYLRSYARLLKLDEREIVNAYSKGQEISSALIPENINIQPGKKVNYAAIKWVVVLLLIAALIGAGLWLLEQPGMFEKIRSESAQPTNSTQTAPVSGVAQDETAPSAIVEAIKDAKQAGPASVEELPAQPSAASTQTATGESETVEPPMAAVAENEQSTANAEPVLRLYFRDDSWTEVTDRDANRVVYRLVREGTDLTIDAQAPFTILLGNAPAVDVYYKGEVFDHKRFHRNEIAYFRIAY